MLRKIIIFWIPTFFWMGVIFFLSSFHKLQASPVSWQDFIFRKTAHFLEYMILFLLFFRGFKNTSRLPFPKQLLFSFFLTFFYSISDEYHQTLVKGRTGKIFDIGVDAGGGIFGLFLVARILPKSPERFKNWFKKINIL